MATHYSTFAWKIPWTEEPGRLQSMLSQRVGCDWATSVSVSVLVHRQRRQWHPTPVLLPGKSHGWRSLEGCSPWGRWGSDTERLHLHFSLSCIGEGNGNPLQRSCLENPRDGEAWLAAVYGVAQSRTRLKWLSSSMSFQLCLTLCDPVDCSPLGSSVHGIFQARIPEWVALPSSRGSSQPRYQTHIFNIFCIGRQVLYY